MQPPVLTRDGPQRVEPAALSSWAERGSSPKLGHGGGQVGIKSVWGQLLPSLLLGCVRVTHIPAAALPCPAGWHCYTTLPQPAACTLQ